MSLEIAYCFPQGPEHYRYAFRFLNSYLSFPGQCEHTLVLLTDASNHQDALDLFCVVPNVRALVTPDYAKDISRYESYVKQSTASCCLLLGGSSYAHRSGWALRAFTAFRIMGHQNIYGAYGHTGAPGVHKHLRSTCWWASPELLRQYPYWPKDSDGRYAAEHSGTSFSAWILSQGGQCWVINFNSEFTLDHANDDPDGYARGSQTNVLIGDRLSGPGAPRFGSPWQT